jgi:short-subunit dehydrogenase
LTGKVIVITGASSGFGKGAARQFAQKGASLVLAARRDILLNELAQECESLGGRALSFAADVSIQTDVEELATAALSAYGRIDVWVNNAGVGAFGRFEETPLPDHVQVIETDLLGTIYGSYFAFRQFLRQGSGILINIASAVGKVPAPYLSSYVAAKHGVVGLSGALRQELEQNKIEGVHVCTVMPTSMDTPFFQHAASYTGHEAVPIPPVYDADEVVEVIVRLATKPEDEVSVGTSGKFMTWLHNIMPGLVEKKMGKQTHKAQFEEAAPAPDTGGAVAEPVGTGTEVSGGWTKK